MPINLDNSIVKVQLTFKDISPFFLCVNFFSSTRFMCLQTQSARAVSKAQNKQGILGTHARSLFKLLVTCEQITGVSGDWAPIRQ